MRVVLRSLLAVGILVATLSVPAGASMAEGLSAPSTHAPTQRIALAAASEEPSPAPGEDAGSADERGGRSWLSILIGTILLGLVTWTLIRSARGRNRFNDGFMNDDELRRNDPDMRHDDD